MRLVVAVVGCFIAVGCLCLQARSDSSENNSYLAIGILSQPPTLSRPSIGIGIYSDERVIFPGDTLQARVWQFHIDSEKRWIKRFLGHEDLVLERATSKELFFINPTKNFSIAIDRSGTSSAAPLAFRTIVEGNLRRGPRISSVSNSYTARMINPSQPSKMSSGVLGYLDLCNFVLTRL